MYRRPTDISHLVLREALFLQQAIDVQLGELEGALVHAFLLHPDYFALLRQLRHPVPQIMDGEGSNLFESHNADTMANRTLLLDGSLDIEGDLARAEDQPLDLAWIAAIEVSRNRWLEAGLWCEFFLHRDGFRMLEANLWSRNDKRLAIVAKHLTAQNVEIVGRGRALSDLEVDVLSG